MTATTTGSMSDQEFSYFRDLIHGQTGIWLGDHKRTMLVSRLSRRLRELNLPDFTAYCEWLQTADPHGVELVQAINRVTTNKTDFFRESAHFDYLRQWLPSRPQSPVHVWCADGSAGDEIYTIAMTMAEAFGMDGGWQVLASDIDTEVLASAERAVYPEERLWPLPPGYKQRYFLRGRDCYSGFARVRPQLRRHVQFRRINLVGDGWPEARGFDAVFCRNVLIYFDRPTQQSVVERLLTRLLPEGLLFLGHSENMHSMADRVEPVSHTVYRERRKGSP